MYRLTNPVKHYDWGSTTAIPAFLGRPADGRPVAEVWMGAHPSAPSGIKGRGLDELVAQDPAGLLGERVIERFGPRLPYLFKILGASRPLSLQVHPDLAQAAAGFAHDELTGLPAGNPERSYHDDQHKPEMLLALSRFEGLCGFRRPRQVLELLEPLEGELVDTIRCALRGSPTPDGMRSAFEAVLRARGRIKPEDIEVTVRGCEQQLAQGFGSQQAYGTVAALAHWYPGDPGAVASLLLNRFTLEPGETVFVGAGVVHAYLAGLGLEVMASSDNVLRAGLTRKKIDVDELLRVVDYADVAPVRPAVVPGAEGRPAVVRAPAQEFALALVEPTRTERGRATYLTQDGPRIVLCTEGTLALRTAAGSEVALTQGESVFVPDSSGRIEARGEGRAVMVFVP
ncbi:mannose-6-phosphate isomerase, class I [Sanguibacter sp. HDW7]|uniref:mannose-6-phosphate isomerase, class I n=1 Tax=Sanguibacter sp. HDW7 TaxID=2714931 RepID=UPI00140C6017|nr:mannose-6-phosphate isomerase, class I [Sanguibacter sp. HDW7]QIK84280.1 mannose-6-phosphate isomerase, class I [Sanguibacter sp. HDW7]